MTTPAQAVLVTRPKGQAAALMHGLAQAGYVPIWASPIAIVPQPEALAMLPTQMAAADVVFFVSPSAVDEVLKTMSLMSFSPFWVAVGQSTATVLHRAGLSKVWAPTQGHDSEAVLALPLWTKLAKRAQPARVLIVRGEGGRPWLAESLCAAGHHVTVAEVYQRQPQDIDWHDVSTQKGDAKLTAVCVTSSEIGAGLWGQVPDCLQQSFKNLLYLTPHERISQTLKMLGAHRVITCALGDGNMVQALQEYERA